jgi:crotonobetainyl-CoA:carnitine CoA-transferase CaiB-like acyl-CoA transferase
MIRHPQVAANGTTGIHLHPQAGALRQAEPAARFSTTPAAVRDGAPALGQHSVAILGEAGFTAGEIDALVAAAVVRADAAA